MASIFPRLNNSWVWFTQTFGRGAEDRRSVGAYVIPPTSGSTDVVANVDGGTGSGVFPDSYLQSIIRPYSDSSVAIKIGEEEFVLKQDGLVNLYDVSFDMWLDKDPESAESIQTTNLCFEIAMCQRTDVAFAVEMKRVYRGLITVEEGKKYHVSVPDVSSVLVPAGWNLFLIFRKFGGTAEDSTVRVNSHFGYSVQNYNGYTYIY